MKSHDTRRAVRAAALLLAKQFTPRRRDEWPARERGRRRASRPRRSRRFALAIAFGAVGAQSAGSPANITLAVNNGDTVVAGATMTPTTASISGISGGGSYTQRTAVNNSTTIRTEIWSTSAGGGTAAATVAVTFAGAPTHFDCFAATYTGVLAIGTTNTATNSTANPSIAIVTQDANNWVVSIFGCNNAGVFTGVRLGDDDGTISGALNDNTAASASSVTVTSTHNAVAWAACALELRSVSPSSGKTPGDPVRRAMQSLLAA